MPTPKPPTLVGKFPHVPEPYRTQELWPAYYLAFGQFINQFGQTETTLSFHLEQYAHGLIGGGRGNDYDDLKLDVLRALIGSRRTGDISTAFKLCMKSWSKSGRPYSDEASQEIDALLSQLGQVRFLRDRTAHYGVQIRAEREAIYFRALNRYTVNDLEKTEEILFQIETLEAATADLFTICRRVPFALGMHHRRGDPTDNPVQLPPWQYKASLLKKRAYQFPSSPQSPSPPPKAWWD